MHTVEEIQAKLFGIPPIRSITFGAKLGELPLFTLLEEVSSDRTLPVYEEERDLLEQRILAGGFHAFMFLVYDYVFDGAYSGNEMVNRLDELPLQCKTRVLFLPGEQMQNLVNNGTCHLSGRNGLIVAAADCDDAAFYIDVEKGESLYQIVYTQNPLPKPTALC